MNFTLLTRGKTPGLYFTPTVNASIGNGIAGSAGITFSRGIFTGNPRIIESGYKVILLVYQEGLKFLLGGL